MLLQLAGYYTARAVTRAEVIASLYASGELGALYDPSDLSTLFQDAAGTTPVTADDEPIGFANDPSPNNSQATQATAASKPLWTGGRSVFDGIDDSLAYPTAINDNTNKSVLIGAAYEYTSSVFSSIVGMSNNSGFDRGLCINGNDISAIIRLSDESTPLLGDVIPVNDGQPHVSLYEWVESAKTLRLWHDGILINEMMYALGRKNSTGSIRIGHARVINTHNFGGDIYATAIRAGVVTTEQRLLLQRWLAQKARVTL